MQCNTIVTIKNWGSNTLVIIKNFFRSMALYLILEFFVILFMILSDVVGLEIVFYGILNELIINQVWIYSINLKKVFIAHNYRKQNKNFNEEYYDLYYNLNLITFRLLLSFVYLTLIIYKAIFKKEHMDLELSLEYLNYHLTDIRALGLGLFLWAVFMSVFIALKYNKKIRKLCAIKKENFVTYTDEEKKILEQD